jgi:cell division protein FtsW
MLFLATLVLVCFSIAFVYSAAGGQVYKQAFVGSNALVKQFLAAAGGFAALLLLMRVDYRTYRNRQLLMYLGGVTVALLVAVLIFGEAKNGATRWIALGPFNGQPSEFAKLTVIMGAAWLLAERLDKNEPLRPALLQVAALFVLIGGLIFAERDLGSVIIIAAVLGVMAFVAGMAYREAAVAVASAVPLMVVAILIEPFRRARMLDWLSGVFGGAAANAANEATAGYHTNQALMTVGSGGVWGRGLGESLQKLAFLPNPETDSIFAVIGEEAGLIGTTAVLFCFAMIIWRGSRASFRARDNFGALLATGLTTLIGFEALLNMSVVLDIVPQKGVALPFLSAGGSSLVASLLAIAILLNVSQHGAPSTAGR